DGDHGLTPAGPPNVLQGCIDIEHLNHAYRAQTRRATVAALIYREDIAEPREVSRNCLDSPFPPTSGEAVG
ncbi:MAG: hypothetical protein ACO3UX_13435, partial [Candidatus Nanopelagicales bacterium]